MQDTPPNSATRTRSVTAVGLPAGLPFQILEGMRESVLVSSADLDSPGPYIVYVNPAFCRVTGYAPADVVGKTPRILQGPETSRETLEQLRTSLEERGEFRGSAVNYRKNGEPFLNDWYIYRVEAGGDAYFVSIQQEVTNFEVVQRHRHALVRGLVSSNLAIALFNARFEFTVVSQVFAQALGRDPFELQGLSIDMLTDRIVEPLVREEFRAALANRSVWAGDLVISGPHGRQVILAVQLSPMPEHADVTAPAFLCTGLDDTENRRYRAVADSIALSNELAGAFGTLRHELGNPINNLSAALTVLRKSAIDPGSVPALFEEMAGEIARMKFLIRSLRGFSSTEPLRRERFELASIARDVGRLLRRQIHETSASFQVDVPDSLVLFGDARAMLQILLNLTTNALDAMTHAVARTVTVRGREVEGGVVIQVLDTGRGMDARTRQAAVRAFYTSKPDGTGLGLPISRSLVSRMNGTLTIDSEVGKGTTITIWMAQRTARR